LRDESVQLHLDRRLGESSENVARKINFGEERNRNKVSGPGYDNSYGEDADVREDKNQNEGLGKRTPPPSSKAQEGDAVVIDLCSSPPVPRSRARNSTTPPPSAQHPTLSSSPLPSPIAVTTKTPTKLASVEHGVGDEDERGFSFKPTSNGRSTGKRRKCKEYVRIRESVGGGAWKDVDEDEILARDWNGNGNEQRKREGVWRRSQIEVLDLTEE